MIKKTLYFGNPAYLSMNKAQLVIQIPDVQSNDTLTPEFKKMNERTIPIEDIGMVVLDNKRITITSGLIESLLENNCALITCDSRSMPTGLMLPLEGNTIQSERFRHQIDSSLPLKKQLWQQTVKQKIMNQENVLSMYGKTNTQCMKVWWGEVKSGDTENVEAKAAAYYWKYIFPDIPDFIRGRELDPPNNLLNYGYAILRAVIARSLVGSGLIPTLGIHHHNRYNAYCLADDIMEPYRPYVDELVIQIMAAVEDYTELTRDIKAMLLKIPVLDVEIEGKRYPLMVAAGITTASVAKCFSGESRQIKYPLNPHLAIICGKPTLCPNES